MKVIRQAIPEVKSEAWTRSELVEVKAYQIVVEVSLTPLDSPLEAGAPRFPVIVDTGNTQDFAIRASQLGRWTGLWLPRMNRSVRIGGQVLPIHEADLWMHGRRGPHRIDVKPGIIVYPDDDNPARLPILGLRALVRNDLKLTVDGRRREVTIETPSWPWWPLMPRRSR